MGKIDNYRRETLLNTVYKIWEAVTTCVLPQIVSLRTKANQCAQKKIDDGRNTIRNTKE